MRQADLERLMKPYEGAPDGAESARFRAALGVEIPATIKLRDAIYNDLDENSFGIGWWKPEPDEARRIFISDYLVGCSWTIETNLVEARLHMLEALEFADQHAASMADAVSVQGNRISMKAPEPKCAADELPVNFWGMHSAGFFRALGSALDCIGGVLVGVVALPVPIHRADLGDARKAIEEELKKGRDPNTWRSKTRQCLDEIEAAAGPAGWLPWASRYRNMLVHRGRRLNQHMLVPRPSLLRADGTPNVRTDVVHLLTRDPERSDAETFVDGLINTLTEPAELTVGELFKSALFFIEGVSRHLLETWEVRRASPAALRQPRQQWPSVPRSPTGFKGYDPGRVEVSADAALMGGSWPRRLRAASFAAGTKTNWPAFLAAAQKPE